MGWPVAMHLIFPLFIPFFLPRLMFLRWPDSSGQAAPRLLYFGWCDNWAAVPYQLAGGPRSDITRVQDKQLAGRLPTKLAIGVASSDEARNAAAPFRRVHTHLCPLSYLRTHVLEAI